MIRKEIQDLKTGARELRKFGLMVGGVFLVLGLIFLLRHKSHYPWFLIPGCVLVAGGLILPHALKYVYIAWMSLAIVLGFIVSNVILTLFFFIVITPVAFVAKIAGKDFLRLKLDRSASTYWMTRKSSAERTRREYERQF